MCIKITITVKPNPLAQERKLPMSNFGVPNKELQPERYFIYDLWSPKNIRSTNLKREGI